MKRGLPGIVFYILLWVGSTQAQEIRTPLLRNVQLHDGANPVAVSAKTAFRKAGSNFPFIDFFLFNGAPAPARWNNFGTEVNGRKVRFNALKQSGLTYTDTLQPTDVLSSAVIDVSGLSQPIFVSFTVSSGATFTPGDSMVFEVKDNFGVWQTLWRNNGAVINNEEVAFTINASLYNATAFEMRWKAYTAQLTASNNETFLLSKVVLSQTLPFPWYESLKQVTVKDSVTQPYSFASPDVRAIDSNFAVYPWGHSLQLDALDALNQPYANSAATYGGTDTLVLNPFNVLQFAVSDTIIFSFAAMGNSFLQPGDSLLVDFRNNLGNWVRTFSLAGTPGNQFKSYSLNINKGRNRHANLQVRFIFKTTYGAANKAAWWVTGFHISRKIELPFIDDFSGRIKTVDPNKWADSYVFVNNDFPEAQPSVNVATFDGLDVHGNAYSPYALKGSADMLTSNSFNLSGLNKADSLIISFYYQYEPQGVTRQIYPDDSLILELRNNRFDKSVFDIVWKVNAIDSLLGAFHRIDYVVKDSQYFHDDFQFRFRNYGSLSGNVSQWHLDYVRFDKGRKINDSYYDVALTNTPRVRLGLYSSMPWYQYAANKPAYSNGSDSIRIVNHDLSAHLVNYYRSVIKPEGDTLDKFVNVLGNLPSQSERTLSIGQSFTFNTNVVADSLVFNTKYKLTLGATATDNITSNDTCSVPTVFSNYYAYDDGTAEGGYGVQLKTNAAVSLRYTLEQPDTLYGCYIFFNQSEKNVSGQRFNIKVWEHISPLFEPATNDKIIYSQAVDKPVYTNMINGFAAFRFSQPIAVKDSFFIGWDQISAFVLNVGLDENFPFGANPNMAYKIDGRWYPSEIPGAVMIRPIVGKFLELPAAVQNPVKPDAATVSLYPNPASSELFIDAKDPCMYKVTLTDIAGRTIGTPENNEGKIMLPAVPYGMYIIMLEHKTAHIQITKKVVINGN